MGIAAWSKGVAYERQFWDEWVRSGGLRWPADYESRLDNKKMIPDGIASILGASLSTRKLLDVGAGPLTSLGFLSKSGPIEIFACDPLAEIYDDILAKYGINPPVRTVFATAEDLSSFYEPSSFDLVHCRNALDHSYDPLRGIIEFLRVAKVGGHVYLLHHPDEAVREGYIGFHQFNFNVTGGKFVIWNRDRLINVADFMPVRCNISQEIKDGFVEVVIRKDQEFADLKSSTRYSTRVAELTRSLVDFYARPADAGNAS